jgi:alpha-N-acetylglucosamine transferase
MNKVSEKKNFILFILLQSVLIFIALLLVILFDYLIKIRLQSSISSKLEVLMSSFGPMLKTGDLV